MAFETVRECTIKERDGAIELSFFLKKPHYTKGDQKLDQAVLTDLQAAANSLITKHVVANKAMKVEGMGGLYMYSAMQLAAVDNFNSNSAGTVLQAEVWENAFTFKIQGVNLAVVEKFLTTLPIIAESSDIKSQETSTMKNGQLKLLAVLNREIDLGKVINSLAHMTLGLGHRIKGTPSVNVFFGNTAQLRDFRTLAVSLSAKSNGRAIYSDFPHTMSGVSGGTSHEQVSNTAKVAEKDITYFGSCFVADQFDARLVTVTQSCAQLKDYKAYESTDTASSIAPSKQHVHMTATAARPDKKITMLINGKLPLAQTINSLALTSLNVGMRADYSELCLEQLIDQNGGLHPNISFHPYTVVKAESTAKHDGIAKKADDEKAVIANTQKNGGGQALATVVFGDRSAVEGVVLKKDTQLFRSTLKAGDLVEAPKKSTVGVSTSVAPKATFLSATPATDTGAVNAAATNSSTSAATKAQSTTVKSLIL